MASPVGPSLADPCSSGVVPGPLLRRRLRMKSTATMQTPMATAPTATPIPIAPPVERDAEDACAPVEGGSVAVADVDVDVDAVVVADVDVDEPPEVVATGLAFTTRPSTTKTPRPAWQQGSLRRPQQMLPLAQKVSMASELRSEPSISPHERAFVSVARLGCSPVSPRPLGSYGMHRGGVPMQSCRQPGACQVRSVHDSRQTMSVCCVSWHRPSGRQMSGKEARVSLVRQHMLVPPRRHAE